MSTSTRPYYVTIGSGSEQLCETLGINPLAIARQNFGVDSLTLEQRQVRGEWATDLAHDTAVRFYRLKEDDTLEQLFMGRVVSPVDQVDASARRRLIRVHSVMQLALETTFHRGDWTPSLLPPTTPANYDADQSGDECSLFYGFNYRRTPGGTYVKNADRQRVDMAFAETFDNLHRLAIRLAQPTVWRPVLASNYWGPAVTVPEPEWTLEGSSNYVDWLVKCSRPIPDAFLQWDYSGTQPTARAGRYGDQEPVAITSGWPTMAQALRRDRDKEASRLFVFHRDIAEVDPYDNPPTGGHVVRDLQAMWPTSGTGTVFDRGARIVTFDDPFGLPFDSQPPDAAKLAAFVGPSILQPLTQGSVTLMGAAWRWCQPGSVLTTGGLRYNVQSTVLDLASESLTASIGLPRHLGVEDVQDLAKWLRRWQRQVR